MLRKILPLALILSALCMSALLVWIGFPWVRLLTGLQPQPIESQIFQGVTYARLVRQSPRPMVIHVIKVDLRHPDISLLVTPGNPGSELPLNARTTSQFLNEFDLQIAINGDSFRPWHSRGFFDYYPHSGDPVEPIGFAASKGTIYSDNPDAEPVLYIARTNRARFNTPIGKVYNAISGNFMVVEKGKPTPGLEDSPQPRTAVALDKSGRHLILVVIDGRQSNYSQGATLVELAEIIIYQGGYFGMSLDGGGSSTMVREGLLGQPVVLNSPIDHTIIGRQRPVGNHLGISAKPINGD